MVGIGGSAGSITALETFVGALPASFPGCLLVTVHTSSQVRSSLPAILSRAGSLPASHARDGDEIAAGRILVAPPDQHLLTDGKSVRLSSGPRVNRHRPSMDVMFSSIAHCCGPRSVVVVLSGVLDDGAVGAALVARAGGTVFAQDPREARFPSMPQAALAAAPGARAVGLAELAAVVEAALRAPAARRRTASAGAATHLDAPEAPMNMADSDDVAFLADGESRLTRLVCPDCGGSLAEVDIPPARYYRCHEGHQYAPGSLAAAQAETAERKAWAAVAALHEYAASANRLAEDLDAEQAERYRRAAQRARNTAEAILGPLSAGELGADQDQPRESDPS